MEIGSNGYNPEQKPRAGNTIAKKRVLPSQSNQANRYLQSLVYGDLDPNALAGPVPPQEGLLRLQENDHLLSEAVLNSVFSGGDRAIKIINRVIKNNPDIEKTVFARKNKTRTVRVISGDDQYDLLVHKVLESGVKLKDSSRSEIQEGEIPITSRTLKSTFYGDYLTANRTSEEVLRDNPAIKTIFRKNDTRAIRVITDSESYELYKLKMQEAGVKLRNNDFNMQNGELPLTRSILQQLFIGAFDKSVGKVVEEVLKELSQENPNGVVEGRMGGKVIKVVKDRELFIKRMQEKGVKLQNSVPEAEEGESLLPWAILSKMFIGNSQKILSAIDKLALETPDLITKRRGSNRLVVNAVRDMGQFTKRMQEAGIKLRPIKPTTNESKDATGVDSHLEKLALGKEEVEHGDGQ